MSSVRVCLSLTVLAVLGSACGPSMDEPDGIQGKYSIVEEFVYHSCDLNPHEEPSPAEGYVRRDDGEQVRVTMIRPPIPNTGGLLSARSLQFVDFDPAPEGHYESELEQRPPCSMTDEFATWTHQAALDIIEGGFEITALDQWDVPAGCFPYSYPEATRCEFDRVLTYTQLSSCPDDCRLLASDEVPLGDLECECEG